MENKRRIKVTFNSPNLYVTKSENGDIIVTAVASDTMEDADRERMSRPALEDMVKAIKNRAETNRPVPIYPDHWSSFPMGKWTEAELRYRTVKVKSEGGDREKEVYELWVKGVLDMRFAECALLYEAISKGDSRYQLSVGGFIDLTQDSAVTYEKRDDGSIIGVINNFILHHIACTDEDMASVSRTRFESATEKGRDIFTCGVATQIFKCINEALETKVVPDIAEEDTCSSDEESKMGNNEPDKTTVGNPILELANKQISDYAAKSAKKDETAQVIQAQEVILGSVADQIQSVKSSRELTESEIANLRQAREQIDLVLGDNDDEPEEEEVIIDAADDSDDVDITDDGDVDTDDTADEGDVVIETDSDDDVDVEVDKSKEFEELLEKRLAKERKAMRQELEKIKSEQRTQAANRAAKSKDKSAKKSEPVDAPQGDDVGVDEVPRSKSNFMHMFIAPFYEVGIASNLD